MPLARTLTDERPINCKVNSLSMSDHVVFAFAGVGAMHIKGKGFGEWSYHFQYGDD